MDWNREERLGHHKGVSTVGRIGVRRRQSEWIGRTVLQCGHSSHVQVPGLLQADGSRDTHRALGTESGRGRHFYPRSRQRASETTRHGRFAVHRDLALRVRIDLVERLIADESGCGCELDVSVGCGRWWRYHHCRPPCCRDRDSGHCAVDA